jgi:hypothetical protein
VGTVSVALDILGARPDPTNTPEMVYIAGTNFPASGYAFPQSSSKAIYLPFRALQYGGGNLTLVLTWYSRSGSTSGSAQWTAALAAITPGDATSVEAKAFATSQNTTTTVNATAKGDTSTTITVSNLDSLANGDDGWIKLTRTDTSMVGDAIVFGGDLAYSDGNSGTPGAGDVVGPASATANALTRYNSTTGKLVKDSPIVSDDSGNVSGILSLNSGIIMPSVARLTSTATTSTTTLTDITSLTLTVPAAGTYIYEFYLYVQASTASNVAGYAVNVTGGTITGYIANALKVTNTTAVLSGVQTTNNTAFVAAVYGAATTNFLTELNGSFVCTASGTVIPKFQMATSGSLTAAIGSWGRLTRIA